MLSVALCRTLRSWMNVLSLIEVQANYIMGFKKWKRQKVELPILNLYAWESYIQLILNSFFKVTTMFNGTEKYKLRFWSCALFQHL